MNFCGWPDMRSLQFPIFLNLKCYKRRHFHLSELWLNWKKVFYLSSSNEESDLLTWFKFSGQEYWLNMSDKFELWLEGHAEDRSWCAELNGWLLGGGVQVMDGWTTQISISFSLGKCEWSGYAQRQLSPQIFQRQNFNIGRKRHHPSYGFFCSNLDLRGGNMIIVIPCICLLKRVLSCWGIFLHYNIYISFNCFFISPPLNWT